MEVTPTRKAFRTVLPVTRERSYILWDCWIVGWNGGVLVIGLLGWDGCVWKGGGLLGTKERSYCCWMGISPMGGWKGG